MKCLFAVPSELAADAQSKADEYVAALEKLSPGVSELADSIHAYGEAFGAAILKLDDADWEEPKKALGTAGPLGGQIFWSPDDVETARQLLTHPEADGAFSASPLTQWLTSQSKRKRPVILLTR